MTEMNEIVDNSFFQKYKKRILVNMLLFLAIIIFVVFIGEVCARYGSKAWPFETNIVMFHYMSEKEENLRWRFSPGSEMSSFPKGLNSLGLKNDEIDRKEKHKFRILYLGDSMVWSGETSTGELYTEVIEKNLEGDFEAIEKEIDIINCGIPGYTTYQELEFLKLYGLDMQPDLVILGFAFNDVYYKYLHKPTEKKLLALEPKQQLHRFNTHSFPGVLFAKSYLAHRSFYKLEKSIKKIMGIPILPFESRRDQYLAWKDYGWNETNALIGEMQKLLNDRNIPMIIIIYPVVYQVDDNYLKIGKDYVLYPQKRIKDICVDYHIPFLDLTGPIYKKGGTEVFKDHLHLNNKGNEIVAYEVTRFLNNNKTVWMSNK